ncbi:MAG TPA: M23 family metallopeptidase [Candidatus Peribacteria bacterium]|nr:M23 family metallopeptidase [Candidatus Peribacteria bacterium]
MSHSRVGFRVQALYKTKKQSAAHFARQKLSFMVAVLSIMAFVMGNMVGQHGWYAFWKSVLGKGEDSMIVFTGTVPPIELIPDYSLWAMYGGDKRLHTYTQAPANVLRPLPEYDTMALKTDSATFARQVYSTPWAAGYDTPEGSHAGVDIDAPRGTPVNAIASGVIEKVGQQGYGFGNYVMIRHPNVPDMTKPGGTTTLYSTYAHLDVILVKEGETVRKGQQIGTVGNTGLVFGATGYHLYFEVDTEDAPFHPYWPFTSTEAANAGLSFVQAVDSTKYRDRVLQYTLSPMLFVQQYLNTSTVVASNASSSSASAAAPAVRLTSKELAAKRRADRVARLPVAVAVAPVSSSSSAPAVVVAEQHAAAPDEVVGKPVEEASADPESVNSIIVGTNTDVDRLQLTHSALTGRSWQKMQVKALDANGDLVRSPSFAGRLYIIATFGDAEIRPNELSPIDFVGGVATVNVLPRGQKTLILETRGAFTAVGEPWTTDR